MPLVTTTTGGALLEPVAINHGPAVALAATGTVIANAAAIASRFTVVSAADDSKGVILPSTASPGDEYLIYQTHATSGLKVYPPVNGDINDGSANAAVVQEGKSLGRYIKIDGTTWAAQFTANA
jgi:hypothetical protein